jgi:uncharacterized membrane protein YqjE
MIHPLFRLIASRPQMVAEHAQAYVELVADEIGEAAASLKRRALMLVIALFCFSVAVVLAGVALMLWGVTPEGAMRAPWALFAGPLLPLALGLACFMKSRAEKADNAFEKVREQINADIGMLREVSTV